MTKLLMTLFFACGDKEEQVDTSSTEEVVEETTEETGSEEQTEETGSTEEEGGDTASSQEQ